MKYLNITFNFTQYVLSRKTVFVKICKSCRIKGRMNERQFFLLLYDIAFKTFLLSHFKKQKVYKY